MIPIYRRSDTGRFTDSEGHLLADIHLDHAEPEEPLPDFRFAAQGLGNLLRGMAIGAGLVGMAWALCEVLT